MQTLRTPFLVAGIVAILLALLVELGSRYFTQLTGSSAATPGIAINYLAMIDALILYNAVWMALSIIVPRAITGRVQGIITAIVGIFGLIGAVVAILAALALLMLMITLLVAIPFGTIAYLVAWGHFAVKGAAATLALAMLLKLAFCILMFLAHQDFLKYKGFVIITALSLGLTWVTGFIHGFLPRFLASIGDAAAALVIGVVAAIWLLLIVITSLIATVLAVVSLFRGRGITEPSASQDDWH